MKHAFFHHFIQYAKSKIKNLLNHMTLWLQLVLFMTLITSSTIFALVYKEYTSTRSQSIQNLAETSKTLLNLESENLESFFSDLGYFCVLPYYDFRLSRALEQRTALQPDQLRYFQNQMYYYYYSRADLEDYYIYLPKQSLAIGRGLKQSRISVSNYDPDSLTSVFEACKASPNNRAIYPSESNSGFLTYYHTLIRVRDREPQALVKVQVDKSYLSNLLKNHNKNGDILLLTDENGSLLFSNAPETIGTDAMLRQVLTSAKSHPNSYATVDVSGKNYLLISSNKQEGEIQLLSLIPLSYIDSQVGEIRRSLFLNGLLLWLCVMAFIYLFIRLLTNPLKILSRQMERTGGGDFQTSIAIWGSKEVEDLSQSFNSMVQHIDNLIRRTYLAELSEKNSRLTALEAQLNPHFLYNTLQAISTEALINDQPQINKMITSLAANLRYTIKGGDLVPFKRELEYVQNYIYLQKIRMDDNLSVDLATDPDIMEFLIPKISIQTLVENSIIHGIRPESASIHIQVTARHRDDTLVICVRDNGNGISNEQLLTLYEDFAKQEKTGASGGIGLANLHTRLHLLYEEPTDLAIHTEYGSYTEIVLTLPATKSLRPTTTNSTQQEHSL